MKPVVFKAGNIPANAPVFRPFGGTQTLEMATVFKDEDHGVTFGMGGIPANTSVTFTAAGHLFISVINGTITLKVGGGSRNLVAVNHAVHIAAATTVEIISEEGATVAVGWFDAPPSGQDQALVVIDPAQPLSPSPASPPHLLLGDVPTQDGKAFFSDASGQWKAGVWQSTGYHRKPIPFPRHEFMHLLEGGVVLTTPEGERLAFEAGDIFLIPTGWVADWHSSAKIKKIYCVFTPSA